MAYAQAILIVSAGKGSNSHTWMAIGIGCLFFVPEDAGSIPACGGCTVCPCACKDKLWWTDSLSTDCALVMQHNSGSCMLVSHALGWTIRGGQLSGGQTVGGWNTHTPFWLTDLAMDIYIIPPRWTIYSNPQDATCGFITNCLEHFPGTEHTWGGFFSVKRHVNTYVWRRASSIEDAHLCTDKHAVLV